MSDRTGGNAWRPRIAQLAVCGLIGLTSTSGCASALHAGERALEREGELQVAYEAEAGGATVTVVPSPNSDDPVGPWLLVGGGLLDALVGANAALIAAEYRTPEDGIVAASLAGAAVLGADLAIRFGLLGSGGTPMGLANRLSESQVALQSGSTRLGAGPLIAQGGEWRAAIAFDPTLIERAVQIDVRDADGRLLHRDLAPLDQARLAIAPGAAPRADRKASAAPVDVDRPFAVARPPDPTAVALIIGIEQYGGRVPPVAYASRDAQVFRDYATRLLGVPGDNVLYLTDQQATKGSIQTAVEGQLRDLVTKGRSSVYVFFAGHGAPDLETRIPYLVPSDGNPDYPRTSCYPLDAFYKGLGDLGARDVTVLIDACFSGQTGRGAAPASLLANARPLSIVPIRPVVPRGVVVLAAASEQQISSSLDDKRHGLFTYFVLKGLRGAAARSGDIKIGDLYDYVEREVSATARRLGRKQTPVLLGGDRSRPLVGQ